MCLYITHCASTRLANVIILSIINTFSRHFCRVMSTAAVLTRRVTVWRKALLLLKEANIVSSRVFVI